jgi:carbonic anhydrase/acetyltransferase-like protein (isoleucine patch superfamily)
VIKKILLTVALAALSISSLPAQTNAFRDGVTVAIDPSVALTNYTSLGEWNTDGNLGGWSTAQISATAVSGGALNGTASGTDPQITLTGLGAGGPDLDLAFNDYVDVRLQVPAGFGGNILVFFGAVNNYFGTANITGFDGSRSVTITNIPVDGAFHVYRIFFGPQVYWRGNLSDVRVDPLGNLATVGQAFAVDYVRVGDLTGEVYTPSYAAPQVPAPGASSPNGFPVLEMSSKHFRFCWDISITSNSFWTASMPHGTLRNFEEVWKNHVWRMGYPEPTHPINTAQPYNGQKRKVNITTWYGGYFTGADGNNIPWVNITPDGLRVDEPTWVPPHEFGHGCQESANTNGSQVIDGQFWENHANYVREQWLYHYPWETNQSNLDPYYADTSHFWIGHGRNYYLCWPFWLYLDENPDNLPGLGAPSFGNFFTTKLWEQAKSGEYLWDTLARLAPGTSVQDILGYMARRNVMWDYSHRAALTNAYNLGDMDLARRWTYAELRQRPDDPSWWQTPIEFAPQQTGYKITRLVPQGSGAGRVVSVNFHGLADSGRGAGWRASFVVVADNGSVRYSSLWSGGTNSVTLAANENNLFLSVAGTPAIFLPESIDDTVQPYQSAPSKVRFPYEIQISGATPFESANGSTSGLIQVANGGGWRASSATVEATAYVGPNARVLGTAKVRANARIEDYAVVQGNATVTSNAVISGHALVRDSAVVKDFAKVRDYGMVIDNSVVAGNARVLQHGEITAGSIITNWATVKGSASTWHDNSVATGPQAWNDAVLDGDFSTAQSVSNGFQFGFEEYNPGPLEWITNRTAPRRLYASYDFASAHDSLAKDSPGVTDGYLAGNPTWYGSDGLRSGFLGFNGTNQYVILDRSLSDLPEITITAWVKWSGGAGNQPVWYFGTAATNCMYFTPDNGAGQATFSITKGGASQSLAWNRAFPIGVWTHVALSLSNHVTGRLYIDGTNVATGAITIAPEQLNAPNVNTALQQNYLARGAGNSLPLFRGAIDAVRVYTGALIDSEMTAFQASPPSFGGVGTLYVDLRAPDAVNAALTPYTIWTNLGASVGNFTKSGSVTYTNNVGGTGIPGLLFDGAGARYLSAAMSIADITGSSDRTLEVWVYNPALAGEETMVSLGDRTGTRKDCAFNFGNAAAWGAVTHFNDDVSWGGKGPPSINAWHHFVYTYDGSTGVQIYVDGALWTSDTLAGVLVTPTGDTVNIGCQKPSSAGIPGQYFSGYLNAVRVWGGVMPASQVTSNYLFGPWTGSSGSKSISFGAISNITVNPGVMVTVQSVATDPGQPPLPLTFSLVNAPANAAIDPVTGLFSWLPGLADANTTNVISIKAQDNATPGLSATQAFTVTVNAAPLPTMSSVSLSNGTFRFQINGNGGQNYLIQSSTNLIEWTTLITTNPTSVPFEWMDTNAAVEKSRYYRVLRGQ